MESGKRTRLSLSRKRKNRVEDDFSDSINIPLKSKLTSSIVEENQEPEDKVNNSSCGENHESTIVISRKPHSSKTKRDIAAWLTKPCNPRTVPCPVCGKLVFLSSINRHLDSNCKSDENSKPQGHGINRLPCSNLKENGLLTSLSTGLSFQGVGKEKHLVPAVLGNVMESKQCKHGRRFAQRKEDCRSFVPKLKSSSNSADVFHEDSPLAKVSREDKHGDHSEKQLKNGSCTIILEGDSPGSFNNFAQGDSTVAQSPAKTQTVDDQECKIGEKGMQKNPKLLEGKDLSRDSTNFDESIQEHNGTLEEKNLEIKVGERQDYEPYYLANFKLVLNNVMSNEEDRNLFNEEDNEIIDLFNEMSPEEQKLYIRLFQRKHGWFRCCKLDYPKICKDLKPVTDSLIEKGFLRDQHQLTNLQEALNLIVAPELKLLVKSLHISPGKKGGTKEEIIDTIVNLAQNQKTLFGSFESVVLKRVRQVLGSCVRVADLPREVFNRVLLLFTMNVIPDEEDSTNNGQAQQLSTLFLANIGKVVYPPYLIDRPTTVFHSRESLIAFANAYQQKHEMFMALESNNFEQAFSYFPEASKQFKDMLVTLKDNSSELTAVRLPEHLRSFSAEWAITKMCYFGVEVMQKWRQYEEAVSQLEELLKQDVFCFDSRGRWYDRLALNLHQHLKRPEQALEVIRQGLSDPHVRFGRHLALVQRAKRILSSQAFKKGRRKESEEFEHLDLKEPSPCKFITISGTRCAQLGVFIAPEISQDGVVNPDTKTFCAVEEYALSYYRQQGFDQGIHGEGSTFSSLYCLFMWDIIFACGIPDVFRSPFQAAPLDMCFDSFYTNRKEIIDRRLEEITGATLEKLQEMLFSRWTSNEGQVCAGLNWERFRDVEQAKQLVSCLGGAILSGIFTRFAQGYRYYRSGLPDLVVWNSSTLEYRIAEVKGPGDKLSTKQQIWLDVLESLGADVEVCYVTDIGSKRLRISK